MSPADARCIATRLGVGAAAVLANAIRLLRIAWTNPRRRTARAAGRPVPGRLKSDLRHKLIEHWRG